MPATSGSCNDLQAERSATPLACCATHFWVATLSMVKLVNERVACSIADPDLAESGCQSIAAANSLQRKCPKNALVSENRRHKTSKGEHKLARFSLSLSGGTYTLLRSSLTVT